MQRQPTQRWAFTWNHDDTNLIVDSQGMCLDGHYVKANSGLSLTVAKCGTSRPWHFTYNSIGQIIAVQSGKCLSTSRANTDAAIWLVPCDGTLKTQLWRLAQ